MTIAYVAFYFPILANYFNNFSGADRFYKVYVIIPLLLIGVIFLQISVFRFVRVLLKINANKQLKPILNNEYYIANQQKSFRNAFVAFILAMGIATVTTLLFPAIPAVLICVILFYIVTMFGLVSWLFYNRK